MVCAPCGQHFWVPAPEKVWVQIREYAFDVYLRAVVRVSSGGEDEARRKMTKVVDSRNWGDDLSADGIRITEYSLVTEIPESDADIQPELFQVDGRDVEP
jgi:hypothetical protein